MSNILPYKNHINIVCPQCHRRIQAHIVVDPGTTVTYACQDCKTKLMRINLNDIGTLSIQYFPA